METVTLRLQNGEVILNLSLILYCDLLLQFNFQKLYYPCLKNLSGWNWDCSVLLFFSTTFPGLRDCKLVLLIFKL